MIRSADLRPGDILQHRDGARWRLSRRDTASDPPVWWANYANTTPLFFDISIHDDEIERSAPDRLWWLDETVAR